MSEAKRAVLIAGATASGKRMDGSMTTSESCNKGLIIVTMCLCLRWGGTMRATASLFLAFAAIGLSHSGVSAAPQNGPTYSLCFGDTCTPNSANYGFDCNFAYL